ncbi:MAG: hypothetical protein ABW185_14220 [Sedimenticola sp.]
MEFEDMLEQCQEWTAKKVGTAIIANSQLEERVKVVEQDVQQLYSDRNANTGSWDSINETVCGLGDAQTKADAAVEKRFQSLSQEIDALKREQCVLRVEVVENEMDKLTSNQQETKQTLNTIQQTVEELSDGQTKKYSAFHIRMQALSDKINTIKPERPLIHTECRQDLLNALNAAALAVAPRMKSPETREITPRHQLTSTTTATTSYISNMGTSSTQQSTSTTTTTPARVTLPLLTPGIQSQNKMGTASTYPSTLTTPKPDSLTSQYRISKPPPIKSQRQLQIASLPPLTETQLEEYTITTPIRRHNRGLMTRGRMPQSKTSTAESSSR